MFTMIEFLIQNVWAKMFCHFINLFISEFQELPLIVDSLLYQYLPNKIIFGKFFLEAPNNKILHCFQSFNWSFGKPLNRLRMPINWTKSWSFRIRKFDRIRLLILWVVWPHESIKNNSKKSKEIWHKNTNFVVQGRFELN